ncbi:DNA gyrase C-terminal beta-propeller domain-containing protein [Candidatus Leptofilum sp.]|uniref:DNA gyrase C-terminal beta-propeller domain-containing protein n=1 Tax=Candidatus Leptofilum sp. TaxID=3241576 RepID=UPI003B5A0598
MELERPDLSNVSPDVLAYIEALEAALLKSKSSQSTRRRSAEVEPSEPPTTQQVITISQRGVAKRTARHLYGRQRRSGIGVFDLEVDEHDFPAHIAVADESERLLLFSNLGRVFPLAVADIHQTDELRAPGESLISKFPFHGNEHIVGTLRAEAGQYVVLASQRGWVQRVAASYFGKSLIPGMSFHDVKRGGQITAVTWTNGSEEIFLATQQAQGIRFRETQVPARGGCLGLRVAPDDEVVAVASVTESSGVFVVGHDGKGTIRLMSGFRMNKAPGAGGKTIFKSDQLIGAVTVQENDDIFILAQGGKMIRFRASEVPPKTGVVQGVNCMEVRNDLVTAVAVATLEQ